MVAGAALISTVVEKVSQAAFGNPLVTNVLRGQVVEAIVAMALEPEWRWCAADYSGWDFERGDGLRLEVKQSAARQSWVSVKPSRAAFDVAARTGYNGDDSWVDAPGRHAHLYVFAHHPRTGDDVDHRDPHQWNFHVVPTAVLPPVKQLGIGQIQRLGRRCWFDTLCDTVADVAGTIDITMPNKEPGA